MGVVIAMLVLTAIGVGVTMWFVVGPEIALWRRMLAAAETSAARASDGACVALRGKIVSDGGVLEAPFHARPAVWHRSVTRALMQITPGSFGWRGIMDRAEGVSFFVEDDSGRRCRIAQVARVAGDQPTLLTNTRVFSETSPGAQKYVTAHGKLAVGMWTMVELREAILSPGDEVTVVGTVEVHSDGVYRQSPTAPITVQPLPEGVIVVGRGTRDAIARQVLRAAATRVAVPTLAVVGVLTLLIAGIVQQQ